MSTSTAYSSVPTMPARATLPALRATNRSPKPVSNSSSTGTRVAIKLRDAAEYRTSMGPNGLLYLDVVVPESMRRERETASQGWSSVAPSTSTSSSRARSSRR